VLLVVAAAGFGSAPTSGADWKALASLERDGALVSASAVDLDSNTVIQQSNADRRLTPASLTKLTTAAAALEAWPPDKMFQTRLLSAAAIHESALAGDLILQGAGDPSLDDQSLWALAVQLKGYGIRSIAGRLVVSLSPFGSIVCGTKDRCDALRRSDKAYNAPLASVGVDFGNWCVIVTPTQAGHEALVRGCGTARLPLPVEGRIRTIAVGGRQTLSVERDTSAEGDTLRLGGDIAMGSEQRIYRSMSDSARGVGLLLAETLRELGIAFSGPVVVTGEAPPANAFALAATEGLELREQLGRMLRFSNNYIADVLTLDLAANSAGPPPKDLSAAADVLVQFMSRVQRAAQLTDQQPPPLLSGSGLTIENRLSANDLTTLLAYQYHDARHFPAFYAGLTVPRDAPFEFVRRGNSAWLDRVALKTGSLNEPVSVCGVAGYLRKRDGGWIAFAVIVNGSLERKHIPLDTALQAAESDLQDILSRY
jgi:D-alanyl-D-alanine carboxypeptidase/D-alanyl-D-alanine-endopeptidase (penicillin-binding protein 4)